MLFSDYDSYLFHEGKNYELYRKMGAHLCEENGRQGTRFLVWAPGAQSVSVLTNRNGWDIRADVMTGSDTGVFERFIPDVTQGDLYRYAITGKDGILRYKADPFAFYSELRPMNASIVWDLDGYKWCDAEYMDGVSASDAPARPMAIYEVHLGSWKKDYRLGPDGFLNYRRLADELSEYVNYMGFTHVVLIGVCEHPFDGSWGYQVTGYYSPTSRYGTPDDFRYFVETMHRHGIGVILDWVPAHFPKDVFGLESFDGTHLYEPDDPLLEEYPEWGTKAFDFKKPEVRNYLISNAVFWIREYHLDALRVDAVAAMLYASFGRSQWRPNIYGGTESLEGIAFLKQLNETVRSTTGGYLIAEDSSMMEGITKPVEEGGMGFMFKWNMGWMNDTLKYFQKDPLFRGYHHGQLTHTIDYAFLEQFILVLSHDEVVHLKRSLLGKMPGADPDKFGGLKTLYAMQFLFPGKKLLFMGQEFAEDREWSEDREINWGYADDMWHRDVMECVRGLLGLYSSYSCLSVEAQDPRSFEWINRDDAMRSTVSFIRRNPWNYEGALLSVCNLSPIRYNGYTVGTPVPGTYRKIFSTEDTLPGRQKEGWTVTTERTDCDGHPNTLRFDLGPYETLVFEIPV